MSENNSNLSNRLMIFQLGEEYYGLRLNFVREVIANEMNITPVPGSPEYYLGMINLRGDLISVLDLRKRFKTKTDQKEDSVIIVTEFKNNLFGLLVDEVMRVTSLQETQNAQFSASQNPNNQNLASSLIESVCQLKDLLVLVIKVDAFLEKELAGLSREFSRF